MGEGRLEGCRPPDPRLILRPPRCGAAAPQAPRGIPGAPHPRPPHSDPDDPHAGNFKVHADFVYTMMHITPSQKKQHNRPTPPEVRIEGSRGLGDCGCAWADRFRR